MTKFLSKITAGVAAASLMATLLAPVALADQTLEISGNGDHSSNSITVSVKSDCTVKQSNDTTIGLTLNATSDTGGNTANSNVGSGVSITTGAATSGITVTVGGSSNSIATDPCCGCQTDPVVSSLISGNGDHSKNTIKTTKKSTKKVDQKNKTKLTVGATTDAKTGNNTTNSNVGGTVAVTTNDATSTIDVTVNGSSNTLP